VSEVTLSYKGTKGSRVGDHVPKVSNERHLEKVMDSFYTHFTRTTRWGA